ncbi:MAG: hypothetical protein IK076_05840 [Bacteroidales bacterium]|nr:hypothetical protein [Bacteroidales bacterium]
MNYSAASSASSSSAFSSEESVSCSPCLPSITASASVAAIVDYCFQSSDSWFGFNNYSARQHSGFVNLLYRNQVDESNDFTFGLSGTLDGMDEWVRSLDSGPSRLAFGGVYGEYTFHAGETFSSILGISTDYYHNNNNKQYPDDGGLKAAPRATVKYAPVKWFVVRANGGRGLRYSNPLSDNFGIFSTNKYISVHYPSFHPIEDSWTFGGNMTFYIPLGTDDASLSLDYFRTVFNRQVVADYEQALVGDYHIIYLFIPEGMNSTSDNYQIDFNVEPFERFTVAMTGRYTDAKSPTYDGRLVEKPMTSRFKGVLNLQYKTNLSRWIFDFTASVNGSARVYDFMKDLRDDDGSLLYENGRTPVYPLVYAQVTRRFKGFDVYLGGENLTGFTQKKVIIGDPSLSDFDASCVWGPIMGRKVNLGVRMTLWR